ncbi:hypothetical protein [Streptomyces sp. TR06-5]|uniref:hypothetical protein n=1 Tax=unclassified Streptomyces TaxID=2593676 RepID=UPI0039A34F51
MNLPDRREDEVRRMLDGAQATLPADLAARAGARGERLLRRRHRLRVVLWTVAIAAAVVFAAWAVTVQPWRAPATSPPIVTW